MKTATKAKLVKARKTSMARPAAAKKSKPPPPRKLSSPAPKKPSSPPPGLDFREFEALRRQLDLSLEELSARLGLTRATVEKRKATGRLTPDESGKVVCFARLLGHAVHLLGGLEEARRWLKAPQRGLHGAVPLDYAQTDLGAREVETLLTRLDYGIKS